jgi:hypothetical protein
MLLPGTVNGADAKRFVTVAPAGTCTAPAAPSSNACSLRAALAGRAIDGSDITWEVTLFFSATWRVQLQAFSEGAAGECQYPIRAWGSYSAPGFQSATLVLDAPADLGITPTAYPALTLALTRVRIDAGSATCG